MKRWLHVTLYGSAAAAVAALACYALGVIGGDRLQPAEALACGSDFSFTGTLRNGLFDGEGEIFYEDGGHYAGGFMAGRFGGAGIYTSPEGWRYEGVFAAGEPSGDGVIWLDEESSVTVTAENVADILSRKGWEYRGGLGERGQTGEGRFLFSTGESYTGGFLLGLAEGQGTYAGANGKPVYEGEWKAGLFHGQGR
ncbi:MAG: hypothetical protein FWH26_05295, partial [Oscillospiraceae bacterium]|nr:hypothetical protein [Oscillospiraceae bacterium]